MALESYWPEYLRELREFRALAGAEEPELTAAGAALRRAPDDFYTATLTDAGCARWERLLGLPVVHGGDLAQRRFRIMTRMNEQRPFTMARLGEMLRGLCGEEGFTLALDGADFLLTVRLALTARQMLSDAAALLDALNSGKVKAAGLDVWLSEKDPNWALASHPAVSCTPHIGAGTKEAQKRIGAELVDIVENFG